VPYELSRDWRCDSQHGESLSKNGARRKDERCVRLPSKSSSPSSLIPTGCCSTRMAAHSFSILAPPPSPCGAVIPSDTPHAVSVSLPTWKDNVDYEEGHPRIAKAMKSGYPRFYIHHLIDRVSVPSAHPAPGRVHPSFP
jgi:hypothetical protein